MPIVTGTIQPLSGAEILKRLQRSELEDFILRYISPHWAEAVTPTDWLIMEYTCHGAALAHPNFEWAQSLHFLSNIAARHKWRKIENGLR